MSNVIHDVVLQDKQLEAFESLAGDQNPFLFYGGAKGGGKSYLIRAAQAERRCRYPGTKGVIIRKTFPELLANHIRKFFEEYPVVKQYYRAAEKAIYWPNGSITEFKYLQRSDDVYNFQGIEYDDITLDEATQHEEIVFKVLKTSLRSDPRIRRAYPDYKPKFLLTGNPGGIGHGWVKRVFIDRDFDQGETPADYSFIPAKIWDNQIFIEANPEYLRILEDLPEDLRRAYLEGDWTVFIGQYFRDFRAEIHGIEPFPIPDDWPKVFAVDWGYFPHPFHVGWYAYDQRERRIIKYREWEDVEHSPDDLALGIGQLSSKDVSIGYGVGDTQMWAMKSWDRAGPDEALTAKTLAGTINEVLSRFGLSMQQANKERVTGWVNLKSMMKWEGSIGADGRRVIEVAPRFQIFNTCTSTLAAYPNMIHSELVPEDMMKQDGDDACDTDRYGCLYIQESEVPGVRKNPSTSKPGLA